MQLCAQIWFKWRQACLAVYCVERVTLESQQSILILDSLPVFGLGLQGLVKNLETGHGLILTGTLQEVLDELDLKQAIELAIIDVEAPGMVGHTTIAMLKSKFPHLQILLVCANFSREKLFGCLALGASGIIFRSQSAQEISSAIQIVLLGGIYVPTSVVNRATDFTAASAQKVPAVTGADGKEMKVISGSGGVTESHLSKQQQAVLRLLVKGLSNKGIAHELNLAEGTVKVHVNGVFKALKVNSRVQAVIRSL